MSPEGERAMIQQELLGEIRDQLASGVQVLNWLLQSFHAALLWDIASRVLDQAPGTGLNPALELAQDAWRRIWSQVPLTPPGKDGAT